MKIELDGKEMKNIERTHDYLKEKFNLPEYYGRNLDALWDILNGNNDEMDIQLYNEEDMYRNLDGFSEKLLSLFEDLSIENNNISFEIHIPKDGSDIDIMVLDDDWCQPYDYQYLLTLDPNNRCAIIVSEQVEKWMRYLQENGVLYGHEYGEYI